MSLSPCDSLARYQFLRCPSYWKGGPETVFLTTAAREMSDALLSTWAAVLEMLGSLGHVVLEALQLKHRL